MEGAAGGHGAIIQLPGHFIHEMHDLHSRHNGVKTQVHGGRSAVIGPACDDELLGADAHNGIHDADGQFFTFQHRALLNMGFDEISPAGLIAFYLRQVIRGQAVGLHDIVGGDAVVVCQLLQIVRLQQTRQSLAAQNTGAEGVAFFLHNSDHLKGVLQREVVLLHHPGQLQTADDAHGTVVFTAIADGIQMGTNGDGRQRTIYALLPADQVTYGIQADGQACRLEFLLQVRLGGSVLGGVGQTGNACAGRCVELRQRFDRLLNTGLICKSHGITSLLDRPHHLAVARLSHDFAVFSHDGAAHYGQHNEQRGLQTQRTVAGLPDVSPAFFPCFPFCFWYTCGTGSYPVSRS